MTLSASQTATVDLHEWNVISCSCRVVCISSPGLAILNMIYRESQSMAEAVSVKAVSALMVRFFLAMLDAWGRSDVKVLLRSDQKVTLTLILHEVQA